MDSSQKSQKNKTLKIKNVCVHNYVSRGTHLGAKERHLPYWIAQCYMPPDTGERAPS